MRVSEISFRVNGASVAVCVAPMKRLLDVLRDDLRLTGTKEGCGEGECGACAVLLNGELVNSCLVPALHACAAEVVTIEGVSRDAELAPVQQCFLEQGGAQCGICTPGMILATKALLRRQPFPSSAQIREGLAGNLCRCTGYMRIFESVRAAAGLGSEIAGSGASPQDEGGPWKSDLPHGERNTQQHKRQQIAFENDNKGETSR